MSRILIVDDKPGMRQMLRTALEMKGHEVLEAGDGESGIGIALKFHVDLAIVDLKLPGIDGIEVLKRLKDVDPAVGVVVISAYGTIDDVVEAMKLGAIDFISKSSPLDEIEIRVEKAIEERRILTEREYLREELESAFEGIVGKDPKMLEVFRIIKKVAPTNSSVLITGESGTGKELVAKAIHLLSPRRNGPFVKVNCAALPETLLETELFGHEKGAFTGALKARKGRFEIADGGTIFLDEIGDFSPNVQVKLLRVLQEKEFERVGGEKTIKTDVRVIAATNKDIKKALEEGTFREDLYWRLNVVSIHIPPLRERKGDIPDLVAHFLTKLKKEGYREIRRVEPEAMRLMLEYDWPGNVRELENAIERAVVLAEDDVLRAENLPIRLQEEKKPLEEVILTPGKTLPQLLEEIERKIVEKALEQAGWVQKRAAEILGIGRTTLQYKMTKYGLKQGDER
jgi:DNA-binding NtrC family response regulator